MCVAGVTIPNTLLFDWFLTGSWMVFERITTSQANSSLVLHCQFTQLPGDVDETSIYSFCPAEQWTSVSNRIHVSKRGESCTEAHRARVRERGRWRKRVDLSLSLHLSLSISPSGDLLMDASIGILLEQLREWRWCGCGVGGRSEQLSMEASALDTTGLVLTHWHSLFLLDVRILGQWYTMIDRCFISSSFFYLFIYFKHWLRCGRIKLSLLLFCWRIQWLGSSSPELGLLILARLPRGDLWIWNNV